MMASLLPDDRNDSVRINQEELSQKVLRDAEREETRSFLNFSRGNLSISHSDFEQGFNKSKFQIKRHVLLNILALILAVTCFGFEVWKLKLVAKNARNIEVLKRDVDTLKHRLLGENLLDELRALERKLYREKEYVYDDEIDIEDINDISRYKDDYADEYQLLGSPSGLPDFLYKRRTSSYSGLDLREILVALCEIGMRRDENIEECLDKKLQDIIREKLLILEDSDKGNKETTTSMIPTKLKLSDSQNIADVKHKRSVIDERLKSFSETIAISRNTHSRHHHDEDERSSMGNDESSSNSGRIKMDSIRQKTDNVSPILDEIHTPKKFSMKPKPGVVPLTAKNNEQVPATVADIRILLNHSKPLTDERKQSLREQIREDDSKKIMKLKEGWQKAIAARSVGHGFTRRHLKNPKQVYAVHYGADIKRFTDDDEHIGNGKVKHSESIFKAWSPSDWVAELGMDKYFSMSKNGRLEIQESGLYLAYAQIHYLDEHDENGFHMLVNGKPILQCMLHNPGRGHKSRSCFSAQITILNSGDHVILKDVAAGRYTLFQEDKSFFGLAKLGEWRQTQSQLQHEDIPS